MNSNEYDFKEQSKALIKRLVQNPSAPLNQGLALAAVEAALREAYARGLEDAKGGWVLPKRTASPARAQVTQSAPTNTVTECSHEWEEAFLDGGSVANKCIHCDILQRDVQDRCKHYFVQTASGEVCVACRKSKKISRG